MSVSSEGERDDALDKDEWVCTIGVATNGNKVLWLAKVAAYNAETSEATLIHFVPAGMHNGLVLYRRNKHVGSTPWVEHRSSLSALPRTGMEYLDGQKAWVCHVDLKRLTNHVDKSAIEWAKEQLKLEAVKKKTKPPKAPKPAPSKFDLPPTEGSRKSNRERRTRDQLDLAFENTMELARKRSYIAADGETPRASELASRYEIYTAVQGNGRAPPAWSRVWNCNGDSTAPTPLSSASIVAPVCTPQLCHPSVVPVEDPSLAGAAPSWSACAELEPSVRRSVDAGAVLARGRRYALASDRAGMADTESYAPGQYMGVRQSGFSWKAFIKDQSSGVAFSLGTFNTSVEAATAFDQAVLQAVGFSGTTNFGLEHLLDTFNVDLDTFLAYQHSRP